jgi:membrane protein implicated in regulation of membrane protease activity
MTVIAVLLLAVATVLLLAAVFGGSDGEVLFDFGAAQVSMSVLSVFLLGAVTVLLFVCGAELLRAGLRRSLRRRRELKQARAVVADHEKKHPDRKATATEPTPGTEAKHSAGTGSTGTASATDPATDTDPGSAAQPSTRADPSAGDTSDTENPPAR